MCIFLKYFFIYILVNGYLCNDKDVISGLMRRHFDETARSEADWTRSGFYGFNFRIALNTQLSSTSLWKVDAQWTGSVTPNVSLVDFVLLLDDI